MVQEQLVEQVLLVRQEPPEEQEVPVEPVPLAEQVLQEALGQQVILVLLVVQVAQEAQVALEVLVLLVVQEQQEILVQQEELELQVIIMLITVMAVCIYCPEMHTCYLVSPRCFMHFAYIYITHTDRLQCCWAVPIGAPHIHEAVLFCSYPSITSVFYECT